MNRRYAVKPQQKALIKTLGNWVLAINGTLSFWLSVNSIGLWISGCFDIKLILIHAVAVTIISCLIQYIGQLWSFKRSFPLLLLFRPENNKIYTVVHTQRAKGIP